jgi:hypothetical protein
VPPGPPPPTPPPGRRPRAHPRHTLLAYVELRLGGGVALVPIRDISAGGVFVKLESDGPLGGLALGDRVAVFVALDPDGPSISLAAEVVRLEPATADRPAGCALMWTTADPEAVRSLAELLAGLPGRGEAGD